MKRFLKWMLIVLITLISAALLYYAKAYFSTERRLSKKYDVKPVQIAIANDSSLLALGGRLVVAKGCTDCHDKNMAGKIFLDDPMLGLIVAPNLT
jgi:hypothetical protein